jgi:hypothetical protein
VFGEPQKVPELSRIILGGVGEPMLEQRANGEHQQQCMLMGDPLLQLKK